MASRRGEVKSIRILRGGFLPPKAMHRPVYLELADTTMCACVDHHDGESVIMRDIDRFPEEDHDLVQSPTRDLSLWILKPAISEGDVMHHMAPLYALSKML